MKLLRNLRGFTSSKSSRKNIGRRGFVAGAVTAIATASLVSPPAATADPTCPFDGPRYVNCVYGRILDEFNALGGWPFFGNAKIPESPALNNGRWQEFEKPNTPWDQNSSIYWHADVAGGRANQVGGLIRAKWGQLGWEGGLLGYPVTRESDAVGGRFNHFERGSIYWSVDSGANQIGGAIRDKWESMNWEKGPLKFPTTDELPASNNWRFNHFMEGSIYWSDTRGSLYVPFTMRARWEQQNWEYGSWGFPQKDGVKCSADPLANGAYGGFGQKFDGGWKFDQAVNVSDSGGFVRGPDKHAVNANREMLMIGSTAYANALDWGIARWNGEQRVDLKPVPVGEEYKATLSVSDYNLHGDGVEGYFRKTASGPSILKFNRAYVDLLSDAGQKSLATHELGHALGLGHSCVSQVMDPVSNSIVTVQEVDRDSYRRMWN